MKNCEFILMLPVLAPYLKVYSSLFFSLILFPFLVTSCSKDEKPRSHSQNVYLLVQS